MTVRITYKKIRLCFKNSAYVALPTCSSNDTHTKYVANVTVENIFIVIKVDSIDETVFNVFHDCNLNYDLPFFGFHADAVDHDEITAVHNKLNIKLKIVLKGLVKHHTIDDSLQQPSRVNQSVVESFAILGEVDIIVDLPCHHCSHATPHHVKHFQSLITRNKEVRKRTIAKSLLLLHM